MYTVLLACVTHSSGVAAWTETEATLVVPERPKSQQWTSHLTEDPLTSALCNPERFEENTGGESGCTAYSYRYRHDAGWESS